MKLYRSRNNDLGMDIIPEEQIWKEVRNRYERNPLGLQMFSGTSPKGYPELFINSPEISWLIKRESLYTGKPGIGERIEGKFTKSVPQITQYGLRPLPKQSIRKLMMALEHGISSQDGIKTMHDLISSTLQKEPKRFDEIIADDVLVGPVLPTSKPLSSLLGGQEELYKRLDYELDKLKRSLPYE